MEYNKLNLFVNKEAKKGRLRTSLLHWGEAERGREQQAGVRAQMHRQARHALAGTADSQSHSILVRLHEIIIL